MRFREGMKLLQTVPQLNRDLLANFVIYWRILPR
jgi:hypothetical protein